MLNANVNLKNLSSRNRSVQSAFRKQQIIDATLDCIDEFGLSQTTLASIAKKAGVSQGALVFHFQSKEALLEKALQYLSHEYGECWQSAIAEAPNDPVNQLKAMVNATFTPAICSRKKISVWYAFWGESRSRPKYQRVCGEQDRQFSDTLLSICEKIEYSQQARLPALTAALSIEGMIDGLWQNFLIGNPGLKRRQAIQAIDELIEVIYPDHLELSRPTPEL
ncbi:MAG: transcriptional regulator BetI [Gammaproteobacteria bacterium]|nr:transcriptional regulator BetI [Gammaproteobacteria bacterium]